MLEFLRSKGCGKTTQHLWLLMIHDIQPNQRYVNYIFVLFVFFLFLFLDVGLDQVNYGIGIVWDMDGVVYGNIISNFLH